MGTWYETSVEICAPPGRLFTLKDEQKVNEILQFVLHKGGIKYFTSNEIEFECAANYSGKTPDDIMYAVKDALWIYFGQYVWISVLVTLVEQTPKEYEEYEMEDYEAWKDGKPELET